YHIHFSTPPLHDALPIFSIKRDSKLWALDLIVRSMDLTTLEGADTPGRVVSLCAKAVRPDPLDPSIPSVAAVCLYPQLVSIAKRSDEHTSELQSPDHLVC